MVKDEQETPVVDGQEPEQFRKIFVGGLAGVTDETSMKAFYEQFGTVTDCIVMKDGTTKRSRGFGFVTFSRQNEVDKAMEARPHTIDDKQVDPKRAVPREASNRGEAQVSSQRLYVSGVRETHTDEMFTEYFSQFGAVTKVEIVTDKTTNKPRGFAFVTFDDYDAVDKCVLKKSHMINEFRCDVKKALSKEEMNRAQQGERDRAMRGDRSRGGFRGGFESRGGGFSGQQGLWTGQQGGWGGQQGGRGGWDQGGWGQQGGYGGAQGGGYGGQGGWGQQGGAGGYGGAQTGGWGQQQGGAAGGWGRGY